MDEKEILQRQVDALEKLLQIKEAIIQEQESKIQKLENDIILGRFPYGSQSVQVPYTPPQKTQYVPSMWPTDTCPANPSGYHSYPTPWGSTVPPHCQACGKQADSYTVTYSDGSQSTLRK